MSPRELNFDEAVPEHREACAMPKVSTPRSGWYDAPRVEGLCGRPAVGTLGDGTSVCEKHAQEARDEGEEVSC